RQAPSEPSESGSRLCAKPFARSRTLYLVESLVAVLVEVLDDLAVDLRHAAHALTTGPAAAESVPANEPRDRPDRFRPDCLDRDVPAQHERKHQKDDLDDRDPSPGFARG